MAFDEATVAAILLLYASLAVVSAAVLAATRGSAASALRLQVLSWWRIFPVFTAAWVMYPLGPWLLFVFIAVFAVRELAQHRQARPRRFQVLCLLLLSLQLLLSAVSFSGAVVWVLVLTFLQLSLQWLRPSSQQLLWLLFLLLCSGLSFTVLLDRLPTTPQERQAWFFYLFVITALNDVAQFVIGKTLGRNKIAATISPNKTHGGLLGGIVVSVLVSLALGLHLHLAAWPFLLAVGALLSVAGFVGDLMFSAGKRYLCIKDFSNLIPGHGGILDRVDSLVMTAPTLYCALHWFLY